ncbi:MAG: hypothetical protein QG671_2011 [Actinomycetota bacterium]|nr:hypothetical protein [Actinomycetota bacterium]
MRRQGMAMGSYGTGRGRRARALTVGVLLFAGLGLSGCQSGGATSVPSSGPTSDAASASDGEGAAGASGTVGSSGRAAEPGQTATAYPAAASATAKALPSLGSAASGIWTLTLNGVHRTSKDSVVVTATVTNTSSDVGFYVGGNVQEEGYDIRTHADGKWESPEEFSAVTITVKGSATQYQVLRDDKGYCACTQGLHRNVKSGSSIAVYAYVTAPPEVTTVTVTVQGFAPFTGIPVQS